MNKKVFFAGVAVLMLLPLGLSMCTTASSVATAPGRVITKTLKTDNIIFNYERFFDINSSYVSKVSQIEQFKGFLASEVDPGEKKMLRVELSAMQQSCRELANKYNNDSLKMNRSLFKDKDLPYELNAKNCE